MDSFGEDWTTYLNRVNPALPHMGVQASTRDKISRVTRGSAPETIRFFISVIILITPPQGGDQNVTTFQHQTNALTSQYQYLKDFMRQKMFYKVLFSWPFLL